MRGLPIEPWRQFCDMPFPTGPAEVGLELIVLPVRVTREVGDGYEVVAPLCRYGHALYLPVVVGPDCEKEADDEDQVASGSWSIGEIPTGARVERIELRLITVSLRPGAFDDLAPGELAPALAHPLVWVREPAFLALG